MDILLNNNKDGTSTGFLKTKSKIILVVDDNMFSVPNTDDGKKKMELLLQVGLKMSVAATEQDLTDDVE